MVDIEKQIAYWQRGSQEDWLVAQELVERGRSRHGLFFAHLSLEKALKAHVCRRTRDLAPRTHNLVRLAELARLSLSQEQLDVLADVSVFNLEGRYPDSFTPALNHSEAQAYLARAREVLTWLMHQL